MSARRLRPPALLLRARTSRHERHAGALKRRVMSARRSPYFYVCSNERGSSILYNYTRGCGISYIIILYTLN
jgi:hypothetical protein